jgi:DNA polymerase-3 subunit alpha/error-prone DNA polymerase
MTDLKRVKVRLYGSGRTEKALVPKQTRGALDLPTAGEIEFVELLGRSCFSFLQGASHPEEMALQAQKLGYKGLALCDLNGLYGVVRGYQAIAFPSNFLTPQTTGDNDFKFYSGAEMQFQGGHSVALLPVNKEGYARLCKLITMAKRAAQKTYSSLTLNSICEHNEDLIALALPPWNLENLKQLRLAFGDRLYLPVWKDLTWASLEIYNQALELEKRHGFTLFVTQRPFMHHPDRKPLHDVLTCILHGTTLTAARTRLLGNRERYLKPLPELALLWQDRPDLIARTVQIAARINFDLSELKYQYPQADLPNGMNATEYLRDLTDRGLSWRYPLGVPDKVHNLARHELSIIHELAYEDYFLTLYDICEFARERGILFQGRGSAANSVVCYALGLTAVDPTKVELLFERFISKERGEPPDIDIDFDSQRREEVIQYIYRKYGAGHAAMVCTVICYRSRLALRETAKVLGIPMSTIEAMVKFMSRDGLSRLATNPDMAAEWKLTPKQFRLLMDVSSALKGFPRHLGIHTGGFLIAQRPITECVPVERATMDNRYVIQWNKDDLTILKMMKIDVLGLGMLGALQKSFELLRDKKNIKMDLASIPAEDPATYAMAQKADTIGVFQIESRAQMSLLPRLRPEEFYDLVVQVAIIRPGPIQGGMVHPYIRRRHGQEKVAYAHPDLKPILAKTFGVPIFQEQIMQIASTVAGFTPGEADELRRIMSSSWKKADLMEGVRQRLLNGMLAHGISMNYAEQIYQTIVGFASYGFPESHSASFALLTYASSYLKCHYPDVFVCALLNSQPMGFYSPRVLIGDAQRHGVKFLPVDIQKSKFDYDLEGPAVRTGLRAIFGLHEKHVKNLLEERECNGPFEHLTDLVKRTGTPRNVLLRLGAAGALVPLGLNARQAVWCIQALEMKPDSLFFASAKESIDKIKDADLVPLEDSWQELLREFDTQGFSLTQHPVGLLRKNLKGWTRAADLTNLPHGRRVRIAGLLSLVQRPPTAKGFAFLNLEDESGLFNVVLLPKIYEQFRLVVAFHQLIEIVGRLESVNGVLNIKADTLRPLGCQALFT